LVTIQTIQIDSSAVSRVTSKSTSFVVSLSHRGEGVDDDTENNVQRDDVDEHEEDQVVEELADVLRLRVARVE
jgi:N-formylglutamate amidohydrolase